MAFKRITIQGVSGTQLYLDIKHAKSTGCLRYRKTEYLKTRKGDSTGCSAPERKWAGLKQVAKFIYPSPSTADKHRGRL
jgi:hypothetical protein